MRRLAVRGSLPAESGHTLMRGRNSALYSRQLFSGFMRCATCGGASSSSRPAMGVLGTAVLRSWRNGIAACANRLTLRAKIADAHLLEGLRAELLAPTTVRYTTETLTRALNRRINERPHRTEGAQAAGEQALQRLQRLVDAIENGVAASKLASAIAERQADVARYDAVLAELAEPLHERLA